MNNAHFANDFAPGAVTFETFATTPADFQKHCIRIMSMTAFAENLGGEGLAMWVPKAPDNARRRLVAKLAYDEIDHGSRVYRLLAKLGVSEAQANAIATGATGTQGTIHDSLSPAPEIYGSTGETWLDLALHCLLMDTAGRHIVSNFATSSFAPWISVAESIIADEKMHEGFGRREFKRCLDDGVASEVLQERFAYWLGRALDFFGPPPGKTAEVLRRYGIKRKDNEQLRREFRNDIGSYLEKFELTHLMTPLRSSYPYSGPSSA